MLYLDFYQLDHRPFAIQPDSAFLFWTKQHKSTFDAIRDTVLSGAPFTLLTGEIGAGKTLLTNELSTDQDIISHFSICPITLPHRDAPAIMAELITALGGTADADDLWQEICNRADRMRAQNETPLIIVDEAQKLSADGAKVLGRLCAGDDGKEHPMQVLLIGQPELRSIISTPDFRLLKSALGLSIHLKPLTEKEVGAYINFRLQAAGAPADNGIFEPQTFPLIYKATKGVPRLINKLCEVCLFLVSQKGDHTISPEVLRELLSDHIDPTTMSLTGGFMDQKAPTPIITLQEPARKPQQEAIVGQENTEPLVLTRPAQPIKEQPPSKKWIIFGLMGTAAVVLSPIGPLPQNSRVIVALYGAPEMTTVVTEPLEQTPVAAAQTVEANAVRVPPLERAYDPVADPAALYFDQAIAGTDREEIAVAYTRAAIRGHARSALYVGQLFATGDGVMFAPQVAAHWYDVASDVTVLEGTAPQDVRTQEAGEATVLFSTIHEGIGEFIWQGNAQVFHLELGDSQGAIVGDFATVLTAALVSLPAGATHWRLRTNGANANEWTPIGAQHVD